MEALKLNRSSTAVLVMDCQNDILGLLPEEMRQPLIEKVVSVIAAARKARVPVIYIVVQFREGYPELSPRHKRLRDLPSTGRLREGTPGAQVHPRLQPQPGELVIVKKRVSSFYGTELPVVLSALGTQTLVLMGVSTNFVVESTARYAADADFNVVVVEDGCASWRRENHDFTMKNVLPSLAEVVSAAQVVAALERSGR